MIKVVHICESDIVGGAARAAFRLHKSYKALHSVESSMLVRHRASDDENVKAYIPNLLSLRYVFNSSVRRRFQDI